MIDFRKIEKKWQVKWDSSGVFETDVNRKKKKFFTSIVIPYVNGNAHIGHSYTYTRTDAYARFKRMQGFNVLLAQGFHATGEPIVGTVERLKNGDQDQISTFKLYGATDKNIEDFKRKGPVYVAKFWAKKMEETMRAIGLSVDWRRTFTLSIDKQFSRFVEWQYNTLRKKGYVVQGTHPVVWCPKDQSPTGDHDRLKGEGESPVEYALIKFRCGEAYLPAATLRPETIYGVTNLWLNPGADYVEAQVGKEKWIVAKHAIEKIKDHIKDVTILKEFDESHQLFGRRCINPVTRKEIPILPSDFVDAETATGVVMSVPAHAPYDYVAIKEMIDKNMLDAYGTSRTDLESIPVINVEGFGDVPAKEIIESMGIKSVGERDKLDKATSTLYKKEFHSGILNEECGPFSGQKVSEVKEKIIAEFTEKRISETMYDVKDVICRCTTKCHVKILENQWFLKYSDVDWKKLARKCLESMNIYPEEARNNFLATIDWLKDKACARKSGLGTKLPWDHDWIVETLSDSTVYMAYYTIAGIINAKRVPAAKLTDDVMNYIFLGRGALKDVAKKSRLKIKVVKAMREEFEHFYPLNFRNSAKDLVQNHLTFMVFQHVALWPESKWPRTVSVNGYVNVEGEKMSKSRGNIVPLKDMIDEHGADIVRINIGASSEDMDDADWRAESIRSYKMRLEYIYDLVKDMKKCKIFGKTYLDFYLLSKMQKIIKTVTDSYETTRFRTGINHALFESTNEIKWYLQRCNGIENANRKALAEALSVIIRLIAPLTPHICEEMWSILGNKGFISEAEWPEYDEEEVSEGIEKSEAFVGQVLEDAREIQKLLKVKPNSVKLFLAEDWKFHAYDTVLKNKKMPVNEIINTIMATDLKRYGNATVSFVQNLYKKVNELQPVMRKEEQVKALEEAKQFLKNEIGCSIEILDAEKSLDKKAKQATPSKPGILLL